MKVPLLDLAARHEPLRTELMAAMEEVLRTNRFIMGPEVVGLEAEVAKYVGCKHAIGVSSGTDALLVALMALDIGPGDEVIVPTFSFFATAGVVSRLGARPVFVDIDPATCNIDPDSARAAVTEKTKAIIPVHLYGQCAEMDPLLELAEARELAIIEDAAQALGAEYRGGRRAGTLGTMGCFSFFPSKNLGAFGDAGAVITNDDALAEKLRVLRVHGGKPKYYHSVIGGNFRIDAIQAAVLRVKLPHLDEYTGERRKNAARYDELLEGVDVERPLRAYAEEGAEHDHIFNQYVIRHPRRDELRAHLAEREIGTEIYYPVPFHRQQCFEDLGYGAGDLPVAEKAAAEVLAIPVYPGLTDEQLVFVVDSIREFAHA